MHLFLIRHGETEHNVAGLLAGVTDSRLTNHGVLQTQRLAKHLVQDRKLRFSHVFASDLQRAYMTADEIRNAQCSLQESIAAVDVVRLEVLREQDFGSLELVSWSSRHNETETDSKIPTPSDPHFKPKESAEAMRGRAESFLDDFIIPLTAVEEELELRIAIVSHGLFLASLWRSLLGRFRTQRVLLSSEAQFAAANRPLEYAPSWTNTGYLELEIRTSSLNTDTDLENGKDKLLPSDPTSPFALSTMKLQAINSKVHLLNLKRTRGGVGSSAFDQRQRSLEGFFKRPKT